MQAACACPCGENEAELSVKRQENAIMAPLTPWEYSQNCSGSREQRCTPLSMSFPSAKRSRNGQTNPCDLAYGRWSSGLHCAFLPTPKQLCCFSPLTVLPALDQPWCSPGGSSNRKAKSYSLRCSCQEEKRTESEESDSASMRKGHPVIFQIDL